ncbi:hypothetical protein ABZ746_23640 [Streptomyces sp. NPDC020096]
MSDDLSADLVDLQRTWQRAPASTAAFAAAVDDQQRERFPDPGGVWCEEAAARRNDWPQDARAELECDIPCVHPPD